MERVPSWLLLGLILLLVFQTQVWAADHPLPPCAEFSVAKDGRPILVPVTWGDETHSFLVDTGAARTALDNSFRGRLGQPKGLTTLSSPGGVLEVRDYACPKLLLGNQDITAIASVICMDLEPARMASGLDFRGILGMDFLSKYAFSIDFDDGKLMLYPEAPAIWRKHGIAVELKNLNGCLGIMVALGRNLEETFIIDTGANVSCARPQVFDSLVTSQQLLMGGLSNVAAAKGDLQARIGFVNRMAVAECESRLCRLDRGSLSLLGTRHLARFHWRIDPANRIAYLSKSALFEIPDSTATSGLSVLLVNDKKVVSKVDPGSPAEHAGIQKGDVLEAVDGRDIRTLDMHLLRTLLTSEPGKVIELGMKSKDVCKTLNLTLKSRLAQ